MLGPSDRLDQLHDRPRVQRLHPRAIHAISWMSCCAMPVANGMMVDISLDRYVLFRFK